MKVVKGIENNKKHRRLLPCVISFMVCMAFILLHCYVRRVWLFGDQSLLLGDAGEQYIFFLSELWDKVHNGGSFFYSRHAGMGYDFYVNFAYYLCSPFNIIALLLPFTALQDAAQGIMVLKWAFSSATMAYYVMHTRKCKVTQSKMLIAVTIGLAYSFSRFLIGYMFCYIWYDVILLLPLLVLQFERMLETGKWQAYYLLLTVCMFCNFYMAFMACIFLCILFVQETGNETARHKLPFFGASALAAMTSMAVILPCVMMQHKRYAAQNTALGDIDRMVCRLWELLKGEYILRPLEGGSDNIPHLYAGIVVLLFLLVIPFTKNSRVWKLKKIGILLFFGLCFLVPELNLLWHGGAVPHSYYQRFGFVVVFFVLQTCLELLPQLSKVRIRYYVLAVMLLLMVWIFVFFRETKLYDFYIYLAAVMLVIFYGILLILYRKKSFTHKAFSYIMCSVMLAELFVNAFVLLSVYQTQLPFERQAESALDALNEQARLHPGERIACTDSNVNLGMWLGKESISGFSSFANGRLMKFMHALGISGFENDAAVEYSGGTPVDNVMFHVAYAVGKSPVRFSDASVVAEDGGYSLFHINRTVGLGYMADEAVSGWKAEGDNVFAMRNDFAERSTGFGDVFEILPNDITCYTLEQGYEPNEDESFTYTLLNEVDKIWLTYTVPKDMDLYMYLDNSLNSIYTVYLDEEQVVTSDKTEKTLMLHIGEVTAGQQIKILTAVNAHADLVGTIRCQMAAYQEEVFKEVYESLSRNPMTVTQYADNRIQAEVDAAKDGLLVTSIQAVDGNRVYVDGRHVTDYALFGDTFLAIPLAEGEHTIVVEYETPYWKMGLFLSLSGMLICIMASLHERKRQGR
ncbi:MAG: YfhO family protein [Clostridium sp.]|nr:YfhO family protein [Clostridium sp.]